MTSIAAAIPAILEHIDTRQRGWDRKARVLLVVARECGHAPGAMAPIPASLFEGLGSTRREARSEVDALGPLDGSHNILTVWRRVGATPQAGFRGRDLDYLLRWTGVPWVGRRRDVVASLRRRLGRTIPPNDETAGQPCRALPEDARFGHLGDTDLSVVSPALAERSPAIARRPGPVTCDDADEPGNPAPEVDPLSLCLSGVLRTPSVSSATDGRTEELRSLTAKLAQAVYELTGQPITGRPLLRAEAVASRHLDDADGLLAYAYGLKGYRRFGGVLDALESWIPKAPTPGRPVCEECGVVGPVEVCTYRLETCPMGADAS